jgi:hypothetical protein
MMRTGIAQWLEAIGSIIAALVALGTVLYFEIWKPRRDYPKLDISISMAPPDCLKSPMSSQPISESMTERDLGEIVVADSYLLRFRVTNNGNVKAESVEVFASNLSKQHADGSFKKVASFLPMNLQWDNHPYIFMPMISPGMYKYCKLAHIIDPSHRGSFSKLGEAGHRPTVSSDETVLSFDTLHKTYALSHLQPPGLYRLTVLIAASNAKLVERTLEINLTGKWFDDESEMLEKGIRVRVV